MVFARTVSDFLVGDDGGMCENFPAPQSEMISEMLFTLTIDDTESFRVDIPLADNAQFSTNCDAIDVDATKRNLKKNTKKFSLPVIKIQCT